jgi:hypothetical protein
MDINLRVKISLLLAIGLEACNPICGNLDPVYNFSVTASVSPSRDSISVGDTLYITSSFPSTLPDKSGQLINYSRARSIGCSIGFNDAYNIGLNDSSTSKYFSYAPLEGEVYSDKNVPLYWHSRQIRYEESNDSYSLKIAVIPNKPGLYFLAITDAYCLGLNNSKACKQASFAIALTNTDQHLYYYENLFGFGVLSEHDRAQFYCFKVVK